MYVYYCTIYCMRALQYYILIRTVPYTCIDNDLHICCDMDNLYILPFCRYGVEVAYALLTTCFYQHNEKHHARPSKDRVRMVEELSDVDEHYGQQHGTVEHFGLAFGTPFTTQGDLTSDDIDVVKAPYIKTAKRFMVCKTHTHTYTHTHTHIHTLTHTYTLL